MTAKGVGKTEITVKTNNGKTAKATVNVINSSIDIKGVTLNKTELNLKTGSSESLVATINPSNTTMSKQLNWRSDNETVATVSANGVVKAVSSGRARITVSTLNGYSATCVVTVEESSIDITSVGLDTSGATLIVGQTLKINGSVYPTYTTNDKTLTWSSSDNNIASVDNGVVKALNPGTVKITATSVNGKKATANITVVSPTTEIVGVSLNKTSASLNIGDSLILTASINPLDTTQSKTLTWTSSNNNVATVDGNGKVIAKNAGMATITVTTSNGKVATCEVTVGQPITKVSLNETFAELNIGDTMTLVATINPADATISKNMLWHTSNALVASVDKNGNVIAAGSGIATISVITANGLVATCTIKVSGKDGENLPDENLDLSSDNTIKSLVVDGKELDIKDTINYQTNNDDILLDVVLNNDKATYEVFKNPFVDGLNNVLILVTAEDGSLKVYTLEVNKVTGKLTNNTNANITINDKKIKFKNNEATYKVNFFQNNLEYKCVPEDKDAICNIDFEDLKIGKNKVTFKVIAADSSSAIYELTVIKSATLLYILIAGGALATIGIIIVIIIIKKKKKAKKNNKKS